MTFITKSKKPIKTTDGDTVEVSHHARGVLLSIAGGVWAVFDADSASRLAIELRLAAIEVEGRGEGKNE